MEWISVKDRLPDDNSGVLLMVKFTNKDSGHIRNEMFLGWLNMHTGEWITNYFYGFQYFSEVAKELEKTHAVEVTHWMPLPEPPKGE